MARITARKALSSKVKIPQFTPLMQSPEVKKLLNEMQCTNIALACCSHGCVVEPLNLCGHGNPSVLFELGYFI